MTTYRVSNVFGLSKDGKIYLNLLLVVRNHAHHEEIGVEVKNEVGNEVDHLLKNRAAQQ